METLSHLVRRGASPTEIQRFLAAAAEQQSASFSSMDLSPKAIDLAKKPRRRSDGSDALHKSQRVIDRMSTSTTETPDLSSQSKLLHFSALPASFEDSLSEKSSLTLTDSTAKVSSKDEHLASRLTVRPAFSVDQDFLAEQWELSPLNHQRSLALRRHSVQGYKINQMFKAHETTKSITQLVHLSIASASHDQDESSESSDSDEIDPSISELEDNLLPVPAFDETIRHDQERTLQPAAHFKLNLPLVKSLSSRGSSQQQRQSPVKERAMPVGAANDWINWRDYRRARQTDRKVPGKETTRAEVLERCKLPPIMRDLLKPGQRKSAPHWWTSDWLEGSARSSGGSGGKRGGDSGSLVGSIRIESKASMGAASSSTTDSQILHQLITDFRDTVTDEPITNFLRISIVGLRAEEPQIWMHVFRTLYSSLGRDQLAAMITDLKRPEPKLKTLQRLQKVVLSCMRTIRQDSRSVSPFPSARSVSQNSENATANSLYKQLTRTCMASYGIDVAEYAKCVELISAICVRGKRKPDKQLTSLIHSFLRSHQR